MSSVLFFILILSIESYNQQLIMNFSDSAFSFSESFDFSSSGESDLSSIVPETPQASTHMNVSELSYKQCVQIQALRLIAGWTCSKIADTIELSLATVWCVCQTPATPVKHKTKIKITTPLHKRLIFEAMKNATNRHKSYHQIATSVGLNISVNTLRRAFEKKGYHHHAAQKKPFLSQTQKKKQLQFAQSRILWDEWDWHSVLWTDECYIWMGETRDTVHVTHTKNEKHHEDCLLSHFSKKNSFMIWSGILASTGEKLLIIWEKENWGSITAKIYIKHILQPVVLPFFQSYQLQS